MLKIVLGVVVGFVAWSILWVGSDQVLMMASPNWYGAHQLGFEKAVTNQEPFSADSTILITHLFRNAIISIMSGFLAAFVAGENKKSPLGLGIILLIVGVLVEAMAWNYAPACYHIVFVVLLVPMTIIGGKLKQAS